MRISSPRSLLLGAALACLSTPLQAKSFEWDAGVGVAALAFTAYRGSSEDSNLILPLPTLSITSRDFNLGRNGAELALNKSSRFKLRLSASGSLPVDSEGLTVRDGMPDLDSSIEIGPALQWRPAPWRGWAFGPELLIRRVIAADFKQLNSIGWTAQARLHVRWQQQLTRHNRADWKFTIGPVFASRHYHDYFYSVPAELATESRPAFQSHGGYSGWRTKLSLAIVRQRLGLYGYLAHDNLRHAAFAASPLVQQEDYFLVGLMLSWRLFGPHKVEI